ncbi:hypothetical protein RSOL_219800 [Rhizoctonia solani AG-3 Rhs1AP]|uniref:Uncharacterized protein n=2 Tax=Rhizoctonia solani AG-3 TaxID=1086053 RepID=A0A074S0P2_9AGAM|nr:hypothetical protein RSOL_219800 [Rhizoctonia solani AG-3 Rhs1AP]KEP51135.1 hypothetical protein V565_067050 [Rhizoctonia solani 123E]
MNRSLLSAFLKPLHQTKCPIQIIQTPSQAFPVSARSDSQPTTGRTPRPPKHDQAHVPIQRQGNLQWRNAVHEPILPVDNTPGLSSNARLYPSPTGHPLHSGLPKLATQVARPHELTTSLSSPLPSHQLEPKGFDTNTIHGSRTGHRTSLSALPQPHRHSSKPGHEVFDIGAVYESMEAEMRHDPQPGHSLTATAASLGVDAGDLDNVQCDLLGDFLNIYKGQGGVIISPVHGRKDNLIPDDHA